MNHFIPLATAAAMTAKFRGERENILKTEYQQQNVLPIAETYDKACFETLLGKADCAGLRIYYGMDENLKIHAIIVAVNESNQDILPSASLAATEEEDIIESGVRCPELCPEASPLNSSLAL
jgi:hypothetical protein